MGRGSVDARVPELGIGQFGNDLAIVPIQPPAAIGTDDFGQGPAKMCWCNLTGERQCWVRGACHGYLLSIGDLCSRTMPGQRATAVYAGVNS